MKKKIFSMLLLPCLLASLSSVSFAVDSIDIGEISTITTPYEYPITPFMDEWKNFESHTEMIAACQIPEDILKNLSTEALAETVMNYPLLTDMLAWSDRSLGFQNVVSNFNGLEELLSRQNGVDYILTTTPMLYNQNVLANQDNFNERNKIRCAALILSCVNGATPAETLATPEIETGEVRTPNGSLVPYYKDLDFVDLNHLFGSSVPFTQNEFDDLERSYELNYPNATKIDGISPSYNCHSYAWYSTSENPYWITSIDNYILDESYVSIYPDDASRGDIATYWRGLTSLLHSALVESYRNNHFYLTSKWDFMGVYSHREDYCPYYSSASSIRVYTEN